MPVLIAWIGEMLLSTVGQLVFTALVSVGVGLATQSVASGVIDHSQAAQALANSGAAQAIGFFGLDKAFTIILSAWAGRAIRDAAKVQFVARKKS
jgi:hypothetical protein